MKTLLQLLAFSLVIGSCSTLKQTTNNNLGQYDDAYATPADEPETVQRKSEPTPVTKNYEDTKTQPTEEPVYRKYKEGEPEEIVRDPQNSTGDNTTYNSSGNNDDYYYDDDDDFSYGRSFQRLRYGDGYSDGYQDALAYNYNRGGGYYNSYYSNPSWGWNRPLRSRFWVGYNTWDGWNVGYNYGYPAWGWRTSYYPVYTSFCDPWYGYSGAWGYYSNPYYGGTPYGYYDPFYNPYYGSWGCYNYGYSGYYGGYYGGGYGYYSNYYNPWYRPVYVYTNNTVGNPGYTSGKGKMTGPRETIGSNSPTKSRNDQISPRSRGGMVQKVPADGGTIYDPKKTNRGSVVGQGNNDPKDTRGRTPDAGSGATAGTDNGASGRTRARDNASDGRNGTPENGTVTPDNGRATTPESNTNSGGTPSSRGRVREIDRSTPTYGRSNETPETPTNSGNNPTTRGRSTETRENRSRSYEPSSTPGTTYEQPKEETKSRGRSYQPSDSRSDNQPSNNNYQRREEPRNTPTPRTNDGGGSRGGGGGYTPAPSGGGSGGSSTPPSRGRGR